MSLSSQQAASAAEFAATRKENKYAPTSVSHIFVPIGFEIMGPINQFGSDFIADLGRRIVRLIDDPRASPPFFVSISRWLFKA